MRLPRFLRRRFWDEERSDELDSYLEVVEMCLCCSRRRRAWRSCSFWSFAEVYGPNLAFVECLMKADGDFDRSAVNEVMVSIRRKVKENLMDRT